MGVHIPPGCKNAPTAVSEATVLMFVCAVGDGFVKCAVAVNAALLRRKFSVWIFVHAHESAQSLSFTNSEIKWQHHFCRR